MFRPCFTNGHGILKSMDERSLWIGIEFLEGARLRKKLGFCCRVVYVVGGLAHNPDIFVVRSACAVADLWVTDEGGYGEI